MKLPYRSKAFIPPEKIDKYLLSSVHNKGKYKAAFFRRLGFNVSNRDLFEEALLTIAHTNDIEGIRDIVNKGICYGKSYEVIGTIIGPNKAATIKTVWKILLNTRKPSLVTVTPM